MAGQRPIQAPERLAEAEGGGEPETPIGTPRSDVLVETEVVAGRGPESTLEYQPRPTPIGRGVVALRHRDFLLYFSGQLVSLIGTWMQIIAQSWLVLELTNNSAFILGALSALQFLPILTLSIFGGVVADRLPRRQLLLGTQSASLFLAVALAALTQSGLVRISTVLVLALLLGVVNAFDMPTRQAFVVELVSPADLRSAIALNSAAFNSARLIGPAIAGLAIGVVGVAGAFYLNAASFVAAIGSLIFIRAGRRPVSRGMRTSSVGEDLREGLSYALHTPLVWLIVLLVGLVGTFGMNFNVLVPLLARAVLGLQATQFGFLAAASGLGSLVAALLLAYLPRTPSPYALLASAAALGLTEIALAGVRTFGLAMLVLAGSGFAMVFFSTLANTILQLRTPNALRGRVMSLYATVFAGTTPIGSLFTGAVAQTQTVAVAFFTNGLISVGAAVALGLVSLRFRRGRDEQ